LLSIGVGGDVCSRATVSSPTAILAAFDGGIDEPRVSPDGRWVAFGSAVTGRWEVWLARYPSFADRRQVSTSGGAQPRWRRHGSELFYVTEDGQVIVVPIACGQVCETGAPRELFRVPAVFSPHEDEYCVTADGRRFIVIERQTPAEQVAVVLNWVQRLPRREEFNCTQTDALDVGGRRCCGL
jgi:hypothetical protein